MATDQTKAHEIAQVLKKYMHAHALSQSDLARRTGVARDNISRYCRGVALPAVAMAARIERATGLNLVHILNRGPEGSRDSTMTIDRLSTGNFSVRMCRELTPEQLHAVLNIIEPQRVPEPLPVYEEQLSFAE